MSAAHIEELASSLGVSMSTGQRDSLARFAQLVRTWNARLDLTAARDERALVEVLFADAMIMQDIAFVGEGASVVDVGSGAGAPALPFALLRPDIALTMVEPLRKRVAFLRTAIGSLDLATRVKVKEGRVERGQMGDLGTFGTASARATFSPELWSEIGLALAPSCLVFTAGEVPEMLGTRLAFRRDYALPWSGAPRVLSRIEKA